MLRNVKSLLHLFLGATVALSAVGCQEAPVARPIGEYNMITVAPGSCDMVRKASATIRGRQDISIYPQVGGTLTELRVKEGDKVKKGQVMFVIDQVPYKAAVASAEAALATAQASLATSELTYESKQQLFESGVVSQFDLTTAENSMLVAKAQLASAEAALVNAKNNLSYTTVKSPVAGVIGTLPYRVGALVSSAIATPLTTVSDNSVMEVYFSIGEDELLGLVRKSGSRDKAVANFPKVSLQLSDGSMYDLQGEVKSMSGVIDRSTGTVSVRADFKNPAGLLHSGATGNVMLTTKMEDVIVIPRSTTFELQNRVFVFALVEGVAKSIPVEVEAVTGGVSYVVKSGLSAGDKIVAEGVGLLREGTPIKEKGAAPVAPAAATEEN